MQYEVSMAEFKATERHSHPTLDVRGQEYKGAVSDDHLKVRVQELKYKVQVLL